VGALAGRRPVAFETIAHAPLLNPYCINHLGSDHLARLATVFFHGQFTNKALVGLLAITFFN